MWTPWGPGEVSCIESCPHFRGKYIGHSKVSLLQRCPYFRGVLQEGLQCTAVALLLTCSILREETLPQKKVCWSEASPRISVSSTSSPWRLRTLGVENNSEIIYSFTSSSYFCVQCCNTFVSPLYLLCTVCIDSL